MNKFRLVIKKESGAKGEFVKKYVIPYGWNPLKSAITNFVIKPVSTIVIGTGALDYFDVYNFYGDPEEGDSENTEDKITEEEIAEVDAHFSNIAGNVFPVKYQNYSKEFYDDNNVNSQIIEYSMNKAMGKDASLTGINISFTKFISDKVDKFVEDNMAGKLDFDFNLKQRELYNRKLIAFGDKIKDCLKSGEFKRSLESELNEEGGPVDIFRQIYESDPGSFDEIEGQSRVMDDEDSDDKEEEEEDRRMSVRERNRAESKRLFEEMEAEDKALEAELRLMEATRPESKKLDGGRIVDNLNWYIRLEQKIEDEGSGLFGMYNKFKKLPVFSFVRAQSRDAKFSKDSRQVKRRYSSILMSKSDPKYRTEIFEAPEYDKYPYYIKQRILILKFLKNELGSKFDSVYNQKMDEIESSNYADDGEVSIMPNKLAKALNKIIKKADLGKSKISVKKFKELIDKSDIENIRALYNPSYLTSIEKGLAFSQYEEAYKGIWEEKTKILLESIGVFEESYTKRLSAIVMMASEGNFNASDDVKGTRSIADLNIFFMGIERSLKLVTIEKFPKKEVEDEPEETPAPEPPAQARPATEEPEEIKVIDEDDQYKYFAKIGLRAVMSLGTYKPGSVQMYDYNIDGAYNVTINNSDFISKTSNSKTIDHFREVVVDGGKTFLKPNGLYYYKVGLATIDNEVKKIFITNDTSKTGDQTLSITYSTEDSEDGTYEVSGYFVSTSAYSGSSGDAKRSKRNILLNYSHEDERFSGLKEKLKAAIMSDANLKIRYPITDEKAVLINGKASQIKPGDDYRINEKRYDSSARFYLNANSVYSLKGGFSRISVGKNFWTLSLKEEEKEKDIFEEIYTYLNKSSQEVYMNPGILYYLNQREKNVYTKTLALIGFMLINQGFFVPGEWANEEVPKLVSQLKTFYDYALQKSSN